MESVKKLAFEAFDLLSEQEQSLVFELIKRLAPDDVVTADDLAAHASAMDEYRRGETVNDEDINWD